MNSPQPFHIEQLRTHDLSLRSQLEQAEARVSSINELITHLVVTGKISETTILGLVIYEGLYNALTGPLESGEVIQAALLVPGGFGVIRWNSADFTSYRKQAPENSAEIVRRFFAFDICPSSLKTLLLPHVQPLLDFLIKGLHGRNQDSQ